MADILVIDDDRELCELLDAYLGSEGLSIEAVHDGRQGLERALRGEHRLVVLDVMLPSMSGFEVLRALRETSRLPVVMLTARGDAVDRIVGLEMGADDYLAKPFEPRELVARIRAVHRRVEGPADADVLVEGELELRLASRTALLGGEPLALTSGELDILELLLRYVGKVVSREMLYTKALGRHFSPADRSVDVHVSNLRRKLGADRIKTVRGQGYLFAREPVG